MRSQWAIKGSSLFLWCGLSRKTTHFVGYNIETMAKTQTGHNNQPWFFNIIYCVRFNLKMSQSLTVIIISSHLKRWIFVLLPTISIYIYIFHRFRGSGTCVTFKKRVACIWGTNPHNSKMERRENDKNSASTTIIIFPESYLCCVEIIHSVIYTGGWEKNWRVDTACLMDTQSLISISNSLLNPIAYL